MKILVKNSDNVVYYAGDDIVLTPSGVQGNGWRDPQFTNANARTEEADLPANWTGGVWSYDGGWAVADAGRHAQIVAAQSAVDAAQARATAKIARALAVDAIQVTTAAGNTFDGDELSQGRMSRAIIALSTGLAPSVTWVLADNTTIQATASELTEALVLAGMAQAAIWVIE